MKKAVVNAGARTSEHVELTSEQLAVYSELNSDVVRKPEVTERVIAAIKDKAKSLINAAVPDWKQRNMIARGVELQDLWRKNGTWTAQEQAEADALELTWAWVKAVRTHSDQLEANIPDTTADDVVAYDVASGWPELET